MPRRRYTRARRSVKRAGGILSGSTTKKVMSGLGSAFVGERIGAAIGINKLIPSAALGYFTGGAIGLVSAIAAEMISGGGLGGIFGTHQASTPAGTVYN